MRKLWIALFFLITALQLQAQKKINGRETFAEAYEYYLSNDFQEAVYSFEVLVNSGYSNSNISYFDGICFLNTPGREKKAIASLEVAIKNISESWVEGSWDENAAPLQSYYYLSQAYRISGNYSLAKQTILLLRDRIDTLIDKSTLALINHELQYSENADYLMKFPVKMNLTNAGSAINTNLDEINPAITADGSSMFFVVKKKFYDAIFQDKKINGSWAEKEELTNKLGSDGEFRVLSVSSDGTKMLLYSYDMFTSGDIYESKYNGTKWSKCKKLNAAVNTGYSESFASYSPDGKTLYFTSNRLGGLGGYDIYKASARENGDWSEAVNLGPTVNTPFDEATPSVSPDGKFLFFSSKGHSSIGGFDIFRSSILDGKYLYARNMGYPINTSSDNINWISTENEQTGYMPAILPQGAGGFDIWKFQSYSIPDIPRFIIYGNTVISDLSDSTRIPVNICLENTESKIRECQENLIPDKKGFRFKSLSGKYELTVTAKGFITQNKRILLDPEQVESDIHIDFTLTQIPAIAKARTIEIRSLFFSFNSVKIKEEFFGMLDTLAGLLKEFPELVLKVSGNTDGLGGKAVNQRFSINRARAVSNYLSSKGIDSARIECMAAGSMKPIALEKSDHGRDIPEGRALNRRVELTLSPTDKVRIHCINPSVPAELRIDK